MLSQQYKKGLSFIEHSASVLDDTAQKLLREQSGILSTYYNRRTGDLARHLQSRPFNVHRSGSGVSLVIDYYAQIRFMDLKKTVRGKKKKVYYPIYNKPLYGFMFGYAYHQLRGGFLEYLRNQTTAKVNTIHIEIPSP